MLLESLFGDLNAYFILPTFQENYCNPTPKIITASKGYKTANLLSVS